MSQMLESRGGRRTVTRKTGGRKGAPRGAAAPRKSPVRARLTKQERAIRDAELLARKAQEAADRAAAAAAKAKLTGQQSGPPAAPARRGRKPGAGAAIAAAHPADALSEAASGAAPGAGPDRPVAKRLRQGVEQFPIQILVPEETREALRRRSEETGASIRHIILRSLAADGIPVPIPARRRE
jgi:hypothetical protein